MGAMENWGLVTYRTVAVLFDDASSDTQFRNRIAYVVAHGTLQKPLTLKFSDQLLMPGHL